ncbi:hypothetical protein jhhlp_001972 [Lomentospora prolificans]|uniref:Histone acetyltransferase type B catalytic subunit n=1 Tax=Lomentospora prolificans TaxID=41688 RepID=A0A2N3NCZ1_9PEZI|nr:hypothetical protein jhhlp_001972 [Lomentospora prolificans]
MAEKDDWSTDANEALSISLWQPTNDGPELVGRPFHPRFTYPIFGDEQQIFGYKGLEINLKYCSSDMRPFLEMKYKDKFQAIGDTEPCDVLGELKKHLPPVAFGTEPDFIESTLQLAVSDSWKPAGELYTTIQDATGTYEVWKGNLKDPAIMQLVKRVQILVLLYIDGGSKIIELDAETGDDRWTVWTLYKKQDDDYIFIGYSTVYHFYYFDKRITPVRDPSAQLELPNGNFDLAQLDRRARLSQFIILPPYQSAGHGQRLYKTIFAHHYNDPQTKQFAVEDPSEAFDDLRDLCDLDFLRSLPEFRDLTYQPGVKIPKEGALPELVDKKTINALTEKTKMVPRQFMRCVEMHLMSKLPDSVRPHLERQAPLPTATPDEKRQLNLWSLFVKSRILVQHRDVLAELDLPDRLKALETTLQTIAAGYAKLHAKQNPAQPESGAKTSGIKRGLEEAGDVASTSKKARVEDCED